MPVLDQMVSSIDRLQRAREAYSTLDSQLTNHRLLTMALGRHGRGNGGWLRGWHGRLEDGRLAEIEARAGRSHVFKLDLVVLVFLAVLGLGSGRARVLRPGLLGRARPVVGL